MCLKIIILCLITFIVLLIQIIILWQIWFAVVSLEGVQPHPVFGLQRMRFENYAKTFNKKYSHDEYERRFENFKLSLIEIAKLNAYVQDAVFGLTKFSDMSAQEFKDSMFLIGYDNCHKIDAPCNKNTPSLTLPKMQNESIANIANKIDWRDEGIIGPVQDQKRCKCCWAMSVTGLIDSMAKKQKVTKNSLSTQQIMDCLSEKEDGGCEAGNVYNTLVNLCFEYYSVVNEDDYPLTLKSESCQINKTTAVGIKLNRYKHMCNITEEELQLALNNGPVIVIVNAAIWRNYLGGIIQRACIRNRWSGDHAVLLVGYDKTGDVPYYIVKNSWGKSFGDNGYVKLEMFKNTCGVKEDVSIIEVKNEVL